MESSSISTALNCLCSVIKGSARVILFCGCILIILIQIFWLFFGSRITFYRDNGWLLQSSLVFNVALSAYGSFASFFNKTTHLKWFSLVALVNAIVFIIIAFNVLETGPTTSGNVKVAQKMNNYAKQYEWQLTRTAEPNEATAFWDQAQYEGDCCGIYSLKVWDDVRPANISNSFFPPSCCSDYKEQKAANKLDWCLREKAVLRGGCLSEFFFVESFMFILCGITFVAALLQGVFAFIASRGSSTQ